MQPRPRIVGIAGRMHSGKGTLAGFMMKHGGPTYVEKAWANNVKNDALRLINEFYAMYDLPLRMTRSMLDQDKDKHRPLLIYVGEVLGRGTQDDFWVRALMDGEILAADPKTTFLISDTRYPNEVDAIHEAGGIVVRVTRLEEDRHLSVYNKIAATRPELTIGEIWQLIEEMDHSPSECQIDDLNVDYDIANLSFLHLKNEAVRLVQELES